VVLVSHNRSNRELYDALEEKGVNAFVVGDARNPRTMQEAITEGYRAGLAV
jgi:hypothetical protein